MSPDELETQAGSPGNPDFGRAAPGEGERAGKVETAGEAEEAEAAKLPDRPDRPDPSEPGSSEEEPDDSSWDQPIGAAPEPRGSRAGGPEVQPVQFPQLVKGQATRDRGSLELLMDVRLPISVELGRAVMEIKDVVEFGPGTVIELNKMAGDLVDVLVNGRLVAQGEVVVVDEHFGVRVTHLVSPEARVRSLA